MIRSTRVCAGLLIFVALGCVEAKSSEADSGPNKDASSGSMSAADADQTLPEAGLAATDSSSHDGSAGSLRVQAFRDAHVYFTGEDNQRVVDRTVDFPAADLDYSKIMLNLGLACPEHLGRLACDFWDRKASLSVVQEVDGEERTIEVARFITPYRLAGEWQLDVTDLRPILAGEVKLRVFVDTWVGPGHAQGAGWLVNADFEFLPGVPERQVKEVLPLWDGLDVFYGDPEKPISMSVPQRSIEYEAGTRARVRALITGHGQGNLDNCAEFCPREHSFTIGEQKFAERLWREDCQLNPVSPQFGNWQSPRAGWCPGDIAAPWVFDVDLDGETSVEYDVEAYTNSCRPEAEMCSGCAFNTGCDYNDSNHTQPYYRFSAQLIVYAP